MSDLVPNETAFMTEGGRATYSLQPITEQIAQTFGCPGADVMLVGRNGHIIGTVAAVTGRMVRVKGWPTRKGTLAVFTPWGAPGNGEPFRGWVADPNF